MAENVWSILSQAAASGPNTEAVTEKASIPSEGQSDAVTVTGKGTNEGTSEGRTVETRSNRRSRFCPDDFELDDELIAFAFAEGLNRDRVEREMAKMKDHEYDRPKSDWRKAFKNWIRKAAEDAGRRQGTVSFAQKARDETTDQFMAKTEAAL